MVIKLLFIARYVFQMNFFWINFIIIIVNFFSELSTLLNRLNELQNNFNFFENPNIIDDSRRGHKPSTWTNQPAKSTIVWDNINKPK